MTTANAPLRFVVLSMPRTGSSMLTERLSTHQSVLCLPAIFSATGWYDGTRRAGGLMRWMMDRMDPDWEDHKLRLAQPRRLLAEIVKASPDKSAIGFKHHLSAEKEITGFVFGSEIRKIILTRNNFLASYSSHKIVQITGQGAARARAKVERQQARFDANEFARFCTKRENLYTRARNGAKGRKLVIDYVEARTEEGMASVARFISIDPAGFGPARTAKRNPDDIISRFENPDDVRDYLSKHSLEHWSTES